VKSDNAQCIVKPHPAPRNSGLGSRSKIEKVGVESEFDALLRSD